MLNFLIKISYLPTHKFEPSATRNKIFYTDGLTIRCIIMEVGEGRNRERYH